MVSQPARMAIAVADSVSLPVAPRKLRRDSAKRMSIMLDMSVLRIWVEGTNYNRRYALTVRIGFKANGDGENQQDGCPLAAGRRLKRPVFVMAAQPARAR